jgi:hypothetical protein
VLYRARTCAVHVLYENLCVLNKPSLLRMLRDVVGFSIWGWVGCRLLATGTNDPDTHTHSIMRKIEALMNDAISASIDWKLDNTEVICCSNVSDVFLYGNLVARIGETWIELFDGNHQTATTKSRLNAILSKHGMAGECVFQKKGQWFVNYDGAVIPFFSGMRLA